MPIRILSNSEEELALHAIQIERIVLKILTCTTIDSSLRIIIPWRLLCPKLSETVAIMMSFFSDCDAHTYLVNVDHKEGQLESVFILQHSLFYSTPRYRFKL